LVCKLTYASVPAIAAAKKNLFQEGTWKITDGEGVFWWFLISY